MHRQVVLQLDIDLRKIIVHPHVRQRGDVGGRDGADVEGDVIEQGTDRGQGEGRVHKGIRGHPGLMEVLRNRSGDDFNSLDFLHGLFRRGADPLEAVLCRGRREKNRSVSQTRTHQAWPIVLHLQSASPVPSTFLKHLTPSLLVPSTLQPPRSTAPAFQVGSFHPYHTAKGERVLLQGCGAAPYMPLCPPPQRLRFSYLAKRRGDRSVHPRHPAPGYSWTQALCLPPVPAKACK